MLPTTTGPPLMPARGGNEGQMATKQEFSCEFQMIFQPKNDQENE